MKKALIATALIAGMNQAAFATKANTQADSAEGTYWGLGIGTVLGAIIGGPPGAAAGAALGGGIGWGQDLDTQLENTEAELDAQTLARAKADSELKNTQSELARLQDKASELEQSNAQDQTHLTQLSEQVSKESEHNEVLASIAKHYTQEVYYRHNESAIPDYAKSGINELAHFMQENPKLAIELRGHTDLIGPEQANLALAQSRIDAIHDYLTNKGIAAERIKREALGEKYARVAAGDAHNYILDRRVAIELSVPEFEMSDVAATDELERAPISDNAPTLGEEGINLSSASTEDLFLKDLDHGELRQAGSDRKPHHFQTQFGKSGNTMSSTTALAERSKETL